MQRPAPVSLAGLLLVGLMHVALLAVMLQRQPATATATAGRSQRPPPDAGRRNAIQWLLPPRVPPQAPAAVAQARPKPAPRADAAGADRRSGLPPPRRTPPRQPPAADAVAQAAPPETVSASAAASATATARLPDDPFAQPAPARSGRDVLEQARRDAGEIDRQLRKSHPERAPTPPPDSKQAILEKGMNEAYEARPLKWYEAARTVELSTPGGENKTRTYKVITALLTYCINISPNGTRSYTTCPK